MRVSLALIALSGLLAVPASAGEQVLEFRYVTKPLELKTFEAPKIEGQTMVMGKVFGVVAFKDGRVGTKDFIYSAELLKGEGPVRGFSTYTFEDGSSITASFNGEVKGGQRHGVYTILSGTGLYANATGTGSYESVPSKFEGATLLTGKFNVQTP